MAPSRSAKTRALDRRRLMSTRTRIAYTGHMFYRQPKESALETVQYEVKLLRYCLKRLVAGEQDDLLRFALLEAFLLHYRNLIRVFSGKVERDDELSIRRSHEWSAQTLSDEELAAIEAPAKALDARWYTRISRYLQHCTTQRHELPQGWEIVKMATALEPVLLAFEKHWPPEDGRD